MIMRTNESLGEDKRKYVRVDTVFPVQFRLESNDGKAFISNWLQGFTNNISNGGICLCVNNLDPELAKVLKTQKIRVSLEIEFPISRRPIIAHARLTWIKDISGSPNKYLVGLAYETINLSQNKKLMRYVWAKKIFAPVGLGLIILLGAALLLNSFINMRLVQGNKILTEQLVSALQESNLAKQKIKQISGERIALEKKIKTLEISILSVVKERANLGSVSKEKFTEQSLKIEELNNLIQQLSGEKAGLMNQLTSLQHTESVASEELLKIDKKVNGLEKANLDKMYKWVQVHQNPRTGLALSFEGDRDMKGWAFTYDQSLAAQAFLLFDDFEKVHKVFDFFKNRAAKTNGLFYNAYYVNDGEPSEYVVQVGPNLWIGIAIVQYTYKTQDKTYLDLAESIAQRIIALQKQDAQGGIRGGPDIEWYSTEHNLDAYAFFNMLYQLTGKQDYLEARDKVLEWLQKHSYDSLDIPIKRGKGDSTIATDTYAWSIAAIGPEKLESMGMSPDRIMDFAESNCVVTVSYLRPEGQVVNIKGFDFAAERHVARGGVISSEWTAQMIIAFKMMADYYSEKGMTARGRSYKLKAEEYLSSLGSMIISSPSPSGQGGSCLPYATQDFVDTGHGWLTPKGKATGSIAGTVYTIFAYYNYNPLELTSK
ncbi:MAG: PilZ domain-containing protein [Candidatus Omnitrophica bacterium]|nr:PilZ domain-containing protein [Candidatus Omnitrophota bacterium]